MSIDEGEHILRRALWDLVTGGFSTGLLLGTLISQRPAWPVALLAAILATSGVRYTWRLMVHLRRLYRQLAVEAAGGGR